MDTLFEIIGDNEYALLKGDFSVAQNYLQDTRNWGSLAFKKTSQPRWKVKILQILNRYLFPSKIRPSTCNIFFANCFYLQHINFSYSIHRGELENTIIIKPQRYLSPFRKTLLTTFLASFLILPAILSPWLWKVGANYTFLFSSNHLSSFCCMLQDGLYPSRNQ